MTEFPEMPVLGPESGSGMRRLVECHRTEVSLFLGLYRIEVNIRSGFRTDGASIPPWIQGAAGSPWDMPRLLAAVVHDALYQLHWKWRWLCDRVYRAIEIKAGAPRETADFEYAAIRAAGWRNWDAVTKEDMETAKFYVSIRTKGFLS